MILVENVDQMRALVGKRVLRTGPMIWERPDGTKLEDWSYGSTELELLNATSTHLFFKLSWGTGEHILDSRWLDGKWVEYIPSEPERIEGTNET